MAIQGLQGTGQFVADERPLNWRQGVLMRFPNGHAPLVALTSAMKKKVTNDPQFHWWERELSNVRLELSGDITNSTDPILVTADPFGFGGADQVKAGDILYDEQTEELMRVTTTPTTATSIAVERGYANTTATAVTVASENPNLIITGSVFEENANTPDSKRYRPVKLQNFTEIFRDSLAASRTAMMTNLRTVDEIRDAKTQTLLYHTIAMEYSFILGADIEEVGPQGQLQRSTRGIVRSIPAENVVDKAGAATGWDEIEEIFLEAFRFGSQEKMCFIGNRALLAIQRMIRKSDAASFEIGPATKEFGMDVRRLFTPYGSLVLKSHPLFNQIQSSLSGNVYQSLDAWMLIVDMANLTYRPLMNSDTQYLPDRQDNGVDGLKSEYLTEAGLEINHGKTHFLVKGLTVAGGEA